MEMLQARKLVYMLAVALMSVVLVACGADDGGDEAEETSGASDAQPTVASATEPPESPVADVDAVSGTPTPTSIDAAVIVDDATPRDQASESRTPESVEPEPGTPAASPMPDFAMTPASPSAATPAVVADAASEGNDIPSDGTTGADIDIPAATPTTSAASATPAVPNASASPAGATPGATPAAVVVSGCEVEDIPPFQGEQTLYRLTVDVNFRLGPGTDCDLALDEPLGAFQPVEVIGGPVIRESDGSEWVQIEVLDTVGWVAFEFLEPAE